MTPFLICFCYSFAYCKSVFSRFAKFYSWKEFRTSFVPWWVTYFFIAFNYSRQGIDGMDGAEWREEDHEMNFKRISDTTATTDEDHLLWLERTLALAVMGIFYSRYPSAGKSDEIIRPNVLILCVFRRIAIESRYVEAGPGYRVFCASNRRWTQKISQNRVQQFIHKRWTNFDDRIRQTTWRWDVFLEENLTTRWANEWISIYLLFTRIS